jgi:hypothetical protein
MGLVEELVRRAEDNSKLHQDVRFNNGLDINFQEFTELVNADGKVIESDAPFHYKLYIHRLIFRGYEFKMLTTSPVARFA